MKIVLTLFYVKKLFKWFAITKYVRLFYSSDFCSVIRNVFHISIQFITVLTNSQFKFSRNIIILQSIALSGESVFALIWGTIKCSYMF